MAKGQEHGISRVAPNMVTGKLHLIDIPWDQPDLILTFIENSVMMLLVIIFGQKSKEKIFNMEDLT